MDPRIALRGVERIAAQRNLFLTLTVLLAVACAALSVKIAVQEERIILVPPLASEATVSNRRVSASYLEQASMVFLGLLLDLSPSDVTYKRDAVLKYTSDSNPGFAKGINLYFAEAAEKYKNFDLATHFTVKNMEIDESKGEVTANGILTSRYGREGFESKPASYRLSFELTGGGLRLKEFYAISEGKKEEKR